MQKNYIIKYNDIIQSRYMLTKMNNAQIRVIGRDNIYYHKIHDTHRIENGYHIINTSEARCS